MRVGIISSQFVGIKEHRQVPYEVESLKRVFSGKKVDVHLVDPCVTRYGIRDNVAFAHYENQNGELCNANDLDGLIIRRTRGFVDQILDFASFSQKSNGTLVIADPLACFSRTVNKVDSIVKRAGVFNQPDTAIFNGKVDSEFLSFPLLAKPAYGTAGIGVMEVKNHKEVASALRDNKIDKEYYGYNLIFQKHLKITHEYRVMVIDGQSIGVALKNIPDGFIVGNASQGVSFKNIDSCGISKLKQNEITSFAERICSFHGYDIAGIDIIEADDTLYVIECNRSPQFSEFDHALGCKCAEFIVEMVMRRVNQMKNAFSQLPPVDSPKSNVRPRIFVGSSAEGKNVAMALQYGLDDYAEVVVWDQGIFKPSQYSLHSLLEKVRTFDYAIFALTRDDYTISRDKSILAPRDNVVFEAGLFMGAIGADRVFLIAEKRQDGVKIPSDLYGLNLIEWTRHSSGDLRASLGKAVVEIIYTLGGSGAKR